MVVVTMGPILECDRLTKRYGRIVALKGITLTLQPGIVGLLGPNGAGKSTLISVVLGQTPVTSGAATVLGLDIRRRQRAIRRRVGQPVLGPASTFDGVVVGRRRGAESSFSLVVREAGILRYEAYFRLRFTPIRW